MICEGSNSEARQCQIMQTLLFVSGFFFYIVDPSMQCISMLDSVKVEGIFRAKLCFFLPLFLLLLCCVETLISCITRSDFGVGFRTFHIQILCISVS